MSLGSIEGVLTEHSHKCFSLFFLSFVVFCGKNTDSSSIAQFGVRGSLGSYQTPENRGADEKNAGSKAKPQESIDGAPIQWRSREELEGHLKLAISVTFEEAPLRDQLIKFSRHEQIGLFVDRRVDSSQQISIRAVDKTFEQILWMIAEEKGLGVCRLGNIFYVGPKEVTPTLQVLWAQLDAETKPVKKVGIDWSKKSPVDWPLLSEPDLLLKRLGETNRFSVVPLKGIANRPDGSVLPHDVWPETKLPDLQINEQIGLLVTGFGNWFEMSDGGVQLVPFPTIDSGQLEWTLESPGNLLKRLKKEFPKYKISLTKGKTIRAIGSPEELAAIQKFIVFDQAIEVGKEKTYTLNTTASRGQILNSIAAQTGRKFEYSPESKKALNEQIKINVKDVNLDRLIKAALEGSELKFKLEKDRLLIE